MRANELMIGDIILCDGKVPMKMAHTDRELNVWVNPYDSQAYPYYGYGTCEEYAPIPLTPKILEKNGFYDRNTQWYYKRFWSNGCFDIAVALDYREIEISKVCGSGTDCEEVEYGSTIAFGSDINVHELQHALRLCGLNGLADNFKV